MSEQLLLSIRLRDEDTFANFVSGPNAAAVDAVAALATGHGERFITLWGRPGSGRSHLLQAACHSAGAAGRTAAYLPLTEPALEPAVLEGLEGLDLVCIDDLGEAAGDPAWETALFHLYNRLRAGSTALLVAAEAPPGALGLQLPDLASRLLWGPVFQLQPLGEEEKLELMRVRARARGLELEEGVAGFLLRRCDRDVTALMTVLDRIDRASLLDRRRVTIPFVKQVLGV